MSEHFKMNFSHPEYEVETRLALLEKMIEIVYYKNLDLEDEIFEIKDSINFKSKK